MRVLCVRTSIPCMRAFGENTKQIKPKRPNIPVRAAAAAAVVAEPNTPK